MRKHYLFLIIIFLLTVLTSPTTIFAKTFSLSISPPLLEISMKPNKSLIQAFTIKNQGETTKIIPKIIKVRPIDSEGHTTIETTPLNPNETPLIFTLENSNYQLNRPLTIRTNETIQLVLRIESATVTETQDFYLALALETPPTKSNNHQSTPILTSLIFLTLTPDGNIPINLKLTNFTLSTVHDSSTPLILDPQIENNSPNMIRPKGKITIKNWRNHIVFENPLYPHLVLGNSTRTLKLLKTNSDIPQSLPLSWTTSFLDIGPHRITLAITSQNDKPLIEETRTTFLFPIQLTIYLILFLILITLFLTTKSSHLKKNHPQ